MIFQNAKQHFMKVLLLVTGKTDFTFVSQGIQLYTERISRYLNFQVKEVTQKKGNVADTQVIKRQEASLLLQQIEPTDKVVLLDERGNQYTSPEFASFIQGQMNSGCKRLVFIIGGAYGFDESVINRAQYKISLSKMTFSHQIVRTIFLEQLYRAFTIINNEPYHHE